MGQAGNSNRNASLDNQKEHSAGRHGRTGQDAPGREAIADAGAPETMKGETGGAFGKDGMAHREGGVGTQGGGGGGGEPDPARDAIANVDEGKAGPS